MPSKWFRTGNFYERANSSVSNCTHLILFRNLYSQMLKQVQLLYFSNGILEIQLQASFSNENKLSALCERFFPGYEMYKSNSIWMKIQPFEREKTLSLFKQLFQHLMDKDSKNDVSTEILAEFKNIFTFIESECKLALTHIISEKNLASAHVNPSKVNSFALINFLHKCRPNQAYDKTFDSLLIQGENPNQYNALGETPLKLSLFLNEEYLKRLIVMGANFLQRPQGNVVFFDSAMEAAEKHNKLDKFNIMAARLSVLEKTLFQSPTIPTHLMLSNNKIITLFFLVHNHYIYTELKKSTELKTKEKDLLFKLYNDFFELTESKNPDKLKEIFFEEDLAGDNKYIETIYSGIEMVGFNLFEIMDSKEDPQYLFLHCAYSVVTPEFRSSGLMSLLAFRLAYSLQQIAPDRKVGIIFLSNHFNSYKMLMPSNENDNAHLNFPLYQPPHLVKLVNELVGRLYEEKVELIHDNFTCYIKEKDPLKVKEPYRKNLQDISEDFFYKTIQNQDASFTEGPKVTPIIFLVEDHNYKKMEHLCSTLGITFKKHIDKLSELFVKLANDPLYKYNKTLYLAKSNYLFFNNIKIKSDLRENVSSTQLRANS